MGMFASFQNELLSSCPMASRIFLKYERLKKSWALISSSSVIHNRKSNCMCILILASVKRGIPRRIRTHCMIHHHMYPFTKRVDLINMDNIVFVRSAFNKKLVCLQPLCQLHVEVAIVDI